MDLKAQLRLQEEMSRTEVERLKSEARTAQETLVERSRETARRLLAEKEDLAKQNSELAEQVLQLQT